eukprot:TRINITY_DN37370_c0_g1_i1.p1 TRINITY_DN37370_c0_g1~~TRINITY_DN37370_c0_g1_i1.p1  ORF type:complete len:480 (+),score=191.68 TRINITY_DN37370_c0_g1_i1:37-1476(+)
MGEYGWVTEWLTQFLKSPVWTTPVQSFVDENCEIFEDGDEEENNLEFTIRHKNFCILVDGLLSQNLSDLGVSDEKFLEILGGSDSKDLDHLVKEYLLSMDDFLTFRKMMEKRNIELELEAMTVLEEIREKNNAGFVNPQDDDEKAQLEAAIEASVQDQDIQEKQLEMEDAELQHALAVSLAAEDEKQKQKELEIEQETKDKEEQKKKVEQAKKEHEERVKQIEEETLRARIEIVSKAAEVQAVAKVAEAHKAEEKSAPAPAPVPAPAPAPAKSSPAPTTAAAPAPAPVPAPAHKSDASAPTPTPAPAPAPVKEVTSPKPVKPEPVGTSDRVQLAPLGGLAPLGSDKNTHSMALGRQRAPLPGITAGSKPTFTQLKSAVVEEVKKEVPKEKIIPKEEPRKMEPSKEELASRENYLKQQRDRLIQKKKKQRETELDDYIKEKTQAPMPDPAKTSGKELDQAHLEMRRALANRVKEDLLSGH